MQLGFSLIFSNTTHFIAYVIKFSLHFTAKFILISTKATKNAFPYTASSRNNSKCHQDNSDVTVEHTTVTVVTTDVFGINIFKEV